MVGILISQLNHLQILIRYDGILYWLIDLPPTLKSSFCKIVCLFPDFSLFPDFFLFFLIFGNFFLLSRGAHCPLAPILAMPLFDSDETVVSEVGHTLSLPISLLWRTQSRGCTRSNKNGCYATIIFWLLMSLTITMTVKWCIYILRKIVAKYNPLMMTKGVNVSRCGSRGGPAGPGSPLRQKKKKKEGRKGKERKEKRKGKEKERRN